MSEQLIECVPNFSEGKNPDVIKQITHAIEAIDGVKLLFVDPGSDMHRTVVTFIGNPPAVKEAAFQAIKKAAELIDMSQHKGSHPRIGATDVFPFIPVSGVTIEECLTLTKEVAQRVGDELAIPVYLYEKSAQQPARQNLAVIRAGEYEGLADKIKRPEWKPDFGPAEFNARAGATVMGVREFLIAYNINLNTRQAKYATDIAFELRQRGRSARQGNTDPIYLWGEEILKYKENHYPCGLDDFVGTTIEQTIDHCRNEHGYDLTELLEDNGIDPKIPEGSSVKIPGKFKHCKAIGWFVPQYDCAQISINLTDYHITSMHDVLEETRLLAEHRGLVVTGSEIVGMVPYPALLETGKFYLKQQGRSAGVPIRDILNTAVQSLGLRDVGEFLIENRVLGLPQNQDNALVEMKLTDFIDEVSRESPAPGGGSISALVGSLGAALGSMVCNLTANQRGSQSVDKILNEAAEKLQELKFALVNSIDKDTNAFKDYMQASRLPRQTDQQKQARFQAMQQGLKTAVKVPLETAQLCLQALDIAETAVRYGNPASITDGAVGAQVAFVGIKGSIYNVLINLRDIKDEFYCDQIKQQCTQLENQAQSRLKAVDKIVSENLV